MKKFFTLVAVAVAAISANAAQIESAFMNPEALGIGADAVAVNAGTVLCQSASVTMSAAWDDTYKAVAMYGEEDVANTIGIEGEPYLMTQGVQGQTNPSVNNLGEQVEGYWVGGQTAGAVFKFDVKQDGILIMPGKITANKQYYAWEGDAANSAATLCAYRITGQHVKEAETSYDIQLPAAEGDNLADAAAMDAEAAKWLKSSNVINALNVIEPNYAAGNSLGVIAIAVYADAATYYINACGSKVTSNGFIFIPMEAPTAADVADIDINFTSETAIAGVAEQAQAAAKNVKVAANGQVVIGNANIAGQQVK